MYLVGHRGLCTGKRGDRPGSVTATTPGAGASDSARADSSAEAAALRIGDPWARVAARAVPSRLPASLGRTSCASLPSPLPFKAMCYEEKPSQWGSQDTVARPDALVR